VTIVAVVYILVTTPLLFIFYKAIGKRYLAHGAAWRVAKAGVSLVALLILWTAILHVGVPGKEAPFGYLLSAFYAVIMGLIYVAVDRYVQQG
jgi:FlaA1/EpsC-like NDP-sugar epimerase